MGHKGHSLCHYINISCNCTAPVFSKYRGQKKIEAPCQDNGNILSLYFCRQGNGAQDFGVCQLGWFEKHDVPAHTFLCVLLALYFIVCKKRIRLRTRPFNEALNTVDTGYKTVVVFCLRRGRRRTGRRVHAPTLLNGSYRGKCLIRLSLLKFSNVIVIIISTRYVEYGY